MKLCSACLLGLNCRHDGNVVDGWGITADLLRKNGINVISEEEV